MLIQLMERRRRIKSILFGKYRMIRTLGQGSSAAVYLAEHILLQSFRAIKCISKSNPLYQYTLNEAHILKNLKHSNIPIIYDIEEDEQYLYIIEEYIEGVSLKSYRINQKHMQQSLIIKFSIQICELISYLHSCEQFILYLDLKPQNIIVSKDNILKLIDFGAAATDENIGNYSLGTKGYAAPEQYTGVGIDVRSDLYGIGILMFYMVTGEIVYNRNYCMKNIDDVGCCSKELKQIINKCLKFNPLQRYQSVTILYNKLSDIGQKNISVNHMKLKKSLTFSIAGSQERMGTTHAALFLTAYINKYITNCIYVEKNQRPIILKILSRYEKITTKRGNYQINDCLIFSPSEKEREDLEEFEIIIKDFGILEEENRMEFLKGEVKILVLGAKEWELDNSEKKIEELEEYKDIYYLFNFLDDGLFKEVLHNMNKTCCYRMPYVANPFRARKDEILGEMLWEILQEKGVIQKEWKKLSFVRRGGT